MVRRIAGFVRPCLLGAVLFGCAGGHETGPVPPIGPASAEAPSNQSAGIAPVGAAPVSPPRASVAAPLLLPGTGRMVGIPKAPARSVETDQAGDVTLNFSRADLPDVVRAILGDALKLNYVLDPKVQGTVTLQTSRPVSRSALLGTMETILRINGAALLESNGLYRIVPAQNALHGGVAPGVARSPLAEAQGFGIQIVPLRYVAATEMQKILEPLAPEGGVRHVDPVRNLLVLAGTRQELMALLSTIEIFDTDWMAGMSFALFPLRAGDAKSVVLDLEKVFGEAQKGTPGGVIRFVPIERLNAVLAISPQAEYLRRAEEWVDRFDQDSGEGGAQLFVYQVRHGRAVDLAGVLSSAFSLDSSRAGQRRAGAAESVAPNVPAVELRRERSDAAQPGPGQPGVAPNVPGGMPAEAVSTAADDGAAAIGRGPVKIIADEAKNAVVVVSTPRQWRVIEAALRKLDTMPLQVLIEATIAEVTLTDELRYGLQWFFEEGNHKVTLSNSSAGAVASVFPGFSYLFSGGDVRAALNALASITDVKVISSPQVMVMDNRTARLQVGDQVPIATQSAVSVANPDAPIVNTIQFRDTGVILEVKPTVNPGGLVILEIKQEVSDAARTTTSGINSPTIQQRRLASTVAVQSDESVALGGLIRDSRSETRSGVPILQDIPVLGSLFRGTTDDFRRTELLVLITPRVVRSAAEARHVTDELRSRLRTVVPLSGRVQ